MEIPKCIILLCCTYFSFASHHSHTIPVEGYETELQDLGEHVDHHETPVRVIKITKTIAVKVPVPYPVKVIEKVPYPVHVNKPYPVPVPHIVRVPQPAHENAHEAVDASHEGLHQIGGGHQGQSYQVQEAPLGHGSAGDEHSFGPIQEDSYNGGGQGHNVASYADEYPSNEGSPGGSSYDAPSHTYYGNSGIPDGESFESKSYEQAIQGFLQKNHPGSPLNYNSYH